MSDFRDIQHGVNDPVDGLDVKRQINDNRTPHERAHAMQTYVRGHTPATVAVRPTHRAHGLGSVATD